MTITYKCKWAECQKKQPGISDVGKLWHRILHGKPYDLVSVGIAAVYSNRKQGEPPFAVGEEVELHYTGEDGYSNAIEVTITQIFGYLIYINIKGNIPAPDMREFVLLVKPE